MIYQIRARSLPPWARAYTDFRNFTERFGDYLVLSAPIKYLYKLSPVVEIGGGYRYRYTHYERLDNLRRTKSPDRSDHFFSLDFRGEIGPKIYNETALGYQFRHINGLGNSGDISINTEFTWEATAKLQVKYGASRDFSSNGVGGSVQTTRGWLNTSYGLTEKLRLDFISSFAHLDYKRQDRDDEMSDTGFFLTYVIDAYFTIDAGWTYQ